jgi:hypothetical protein
MLYKRTNKAGNLVELLAISDVSFVRAKLEDRLYKTIVILNSGEIVHMNLTQDELSELCEKVQFNMERSGIYTPKPEAKVAKEGSTELGNTILLCKDPKSIQSPPTGAEVPVSPIDDLLSAEIDSMLDNLETDPVKTEGQE